MIINVKSLCCQGYGAYIVRRDDFDERLLGESQKGICLNALAGIFSNVDDAAFHERGSTLGTCKWRFRIGLVGLQ